MSCPRPCSRRLRAMRCACSLVLSRLMLNAMRNFRAPVTVAPQLGTKELGPKSGAHSACLSCGKTPLGCVVPRERGTPLGLGKGKEEGTRPRPPWRGDTHLLGEGLVLPGPDGRQGPATGCLRRLPVEVHCERGGPVRLPAWGGPESPLPEERRGGPLPPASARGTNLPRSPSLWAS